MERPKNKSIFNMRSLTKNEKNLLVGFGLLLLLWLSFKFILEPQKIKITNLEDEKNRYNLIISEQSRILKNEELIEKQLKTLGEEKKKVVSKYFPSLDQAQILYLLNDLIQDERVNVQDLAFTRPYIEDKGELEIRKMDIKIPFSGSYDGITDIIRAINKSQRSIIVNSMSMDREDSNNLAGNIDLKIYSLEGLVETNKDIIHVYVPNTSNATPFLPYTDYRTPNMDSEELVTEDFNEDTTSMDKENDHIVQASEEVKKQGTMLYDFEDRKYEFYPSSPRVQGRVVPSSTKKTGNYSMRLEYNILALEDENRAYIDLGKNNIVLKIPPDSLGIWIYSYGYSPGTLGIRLKSQTNEEMDIELKQGITWTGWSYIETDLPMDLKLYPLKIDKLFYEIAYDREDFGVLLFDGLQAHYPQSNGDGSNSNSYNQFYIVEAGDNITEISRKVYGTIKYKNEIMKLNGIGPGDSLAVGQVLVLKPH